MRRTLGILLLTATLTLAGCGSDDESDQQVADPGPTGGSSSTEPSGYSELFSASDSGGEIDLTATPLPDEAAVTAFAGQLDDRLAAEVSAAAAEVDVPDGQALYGAVVAIGCQPPTEVSVTGSGADVQVRPTVVKESPEVQCLVPVTTVALVLAPA